MTRLTLLCCCLGLSLAACARSSVPPAPSSTTQAASVAPATAALAGYHWRLERAQDARGQRIDALLVRPQTPLQLDFADGRVVVSNACNRISGPVRSEGTGLHIGPLVSTKMACVDPAVMALDAAITKRLEGTPTHAIQESMPPQLVWRTADGDVLHFVGDPTPETKYGGPGETRFFEVDAQTVPCQVSLAPRTVDCLRVREVRYDDAGQRIGRPSEWQALGTGIEGYTHEPGFRDVLRVKRYTIANPPADAPSVAYVLDQVVESAAIDR